MDLFQSWNPGKVKEIFAMGARDLAGSTVAAVEKFLTAVRSARGDLGSYTRRTVSPSA